jgi:hypothetical protein
MKKNRLLEIIREEIAGALNELEKGEVKVPKGTPASTVKYHTDKGFDVKFVDPMTDKMVQKESELEEGQLDEDMLTEAPFIGGSLDFAYIDGKLEKGILGKAIADATKAIESSFPEVNPDAATKIITSKKSRTASSTPEPVKDALENIDDVIKAQANTFGDENFLQKLKTSEKFSTDEEIAIDNYIEKATIPDEKTGDVKRYVEKLGFPQTLRAVEKTLSGEDPINVEPKITSTKPKSTASSKAEKPKKATLTKGDDGFDDVSYSKPKKEEPKKVEPKKEKESSEEKADKAARGGSKLDKISDDKDKLLKALKSAKEERLAVAEKRKNAKDEAEKEKLLNDLKRINKLEGELQNRIDKLKF